MAFDWLKRLAKPQPSAAPQVAEQTPAPAIAEAPAVSIPREKVAQRAYEKWVARGRPVGTSTQDWLEAEAELRAEYLNQRAERPPHRSR